MNSLSIAKLESVSGVEMKNSETVSEYIHRLSDLSGMRKDSTDELAEYFEKKMYSPDEPDIDADLVNKFEEKIEKINKKESDTTDVISSDDSTGESRKNHKKDRNENHIDDSNNLSWNSNINKSDNTSKDEPQDKNIASQTKSEIEKDSNGSTEQINDLSGTNNTTKHSTEAKTLKNIIFGKNIPYFDTIKKSRNYIIPNSLLYSVKNNIAALIIT